VTATGTLLSRLAGADESFLRSVLSTVSDPCRRLPGASPGLDRRISSLVRLAAVLAVDGSSESVCWAADTAAANGADDDDLLAVLLTVAPCAGGGNVAVGASRLAAALGYT
jgi:alkylhydroperoxidase/carboxymuconolactone decarboxylase family protein YurZ